MERDPPTFRPAKDPYEPTPESREALGAYDDDGETYEAEAWQGPEEDEDASFITEEEREPFDWPAFFRRHAVLFGAVACLALSPGSYLLLAASLPAVALFASSLFMLAGFGLAVLTFLPASGFITWRRRLEVVGYRVAGAAAAYVVLGYAVLFIVNLAAPSELVPLDWPEGVQRRLLFWPFYLMVALGCNWAFGVCPPPPG